MTTTLNRSTSRIFATLALGLALGLGAMTQSVSAQAAKEPTDGFFDVPAREDTAEAWGLPAYMAVSTLAAGAVFILCKSARRA